MYTLVDMKSIYTWDDYYLFMKNPHLIGYLAGMNDLQPIHSKWIHDVHDSHDDFSMMACRASFKTSAIDIIGALYRMMKEPDSTMAITRKTYTAASEVIKAIRDISEMPAVHELMRFAFFADNNGDISPKSDWKYKTRKDGKIDLSVRESSTPECTVEALGLDSKITGRHYDFCICDDIVDINDRIYSASREYTKLIMAEIRGNVVKKSGHTAIIGTKWARDDAFDVLEREGVLTADNIYPWQSLPFISEESIDKARRAQTPALFACNYELRYDSGSDCLFKEPIMKPWDFKHATNIVCHIDAAYGGADNNAITILCSLPKGRIGVAGFRRSGHIKDVMDFACRRMQYYSAKKLLMEDNSDKGYTVDQAEDMAREKHYSIWTEGYHETMNKQNKISSILYDNWDKLVFANETDAEYLCEITDWNETVTNGDDCPDSLASGLLHGGFINEDWRDLYK